MQFYIITRRLTLTNLLNCVVLFTFILCAREFYRIQAYYGHNELDRTCKILVRGALAGRFGNQLFQYISGLVSARVLGLDKSAFCVNQGKHDILRPAFGNLTAPVIDDSTYDSMLHFATEITNKVGSVGFWRNLNASLASSAGPALITQIVLPASIVQENVDFIKNELRFRESLTELVREFFNQSASKVGHQPTTFIGVHMRRRDFVNSKDGVLHRKGIERKGNVKWILFAMRILLHRLKLNFKRAVFVVATDDPGWAQEFIWHRNYTIVFTSSYALEPWLYSPRDSSDRFAPQEFDFAALSHCNHSIVEFGTYGFWSSFLAGGQVIVKATKTTTNVRNDSVLKDTDGERAWWQPIPGTHWILEPTMESVYWAENLKHRYFFLETPEHLKTGELRGL